VDQPHASLIAAGAKQVHLVESKPRITRGQVLIAAAMPPREQLERDCRDHPAVGKALHGLGYCKYSDLPNSCLVARVELLGVHRIGHRGKDKWWDQVADIELDLAPIDVGRLAMRLRLVQPIDPPVAVEHGMLPWFEVPGQGFQI